VGLVQGIAPSVNRLRIFRFGWWACNVLLACALVATLWTGVWEYSVRQYLAGFSDAIVADSALPQQKAEAILDWMRIGPPRMNAPHVAQLSARDPQDTLNYQQLLEVCGSATNAFLNLSRSTRVPARRLLLLGSDRTAKHVVAEVLVDDKWVIVDATYRTFMRDAHGNLLTREELKDPKIFDEATARIPNYVRDFSYENTAHIRVAALPVLGPMARTVLNKLIPDWDGSTDWSLLLERRSFLYLFFSVIAFLMLLIARAVLAWLADHRLQAPRFHLRANLARATITFFSTPEIK
jgi:Transglutaminase-like superfamily